MLDTASGTWGTAQTSPRHQPDPQHHVMAIVSSSYASLTQSSYSGTIHTNFARWCSIAACSGLLWGASLNSSARSAWFAYMGMMGWQGHLDGGEGNQQPKQQAWSRLTSSTFSKSEAHAWGPPRAWPMSTTKVRLRAEPAGTGLGRVALKRCLHCSSTSFCRSQSLGLRTGGLGNLSAAG